MDGVRDSKTVDGVKHEYITQGGNVTLERWNDGEEKSLEFIYDNGGAPYSVIYSRGNIEWRKDEKRSCNGCSERYC